MATARLRSPARRAPEPRAARATRPIAAARSTLGSVRHSATNATTPSRPSSRRPPPADADPAGGGQHEREQQGEVGPRHGGQMGQARSLAKSASSSAVRPDGVAHHQRRHQRPRLGCPRARPRPAAPRGPARPAAPAATGAAGQDRLRPATRTTAATSDPRSGGSSRASTRHLGPDRQPGPRSAAGSPPTTTSTGARTRQVSPAAGDLPHGDADRRRTPGRPACPRRHRRVGADLQPHRARPPPPAPASATGPLASRWACSPPAADRARRARRRPRPTTPTGARRPPARLPTTPRREHDQRRRRRPGAQPGRGPARQRQRDHAAGPGRAPGRRPSAARSPRRSAVVRSLTPGRAGRSGRTSSVRCRPPPAAPRPR